MLIDDVTLIETEVEALQSPLVPITVYAVLLEGFTIIGFAVAPVLQEYEEAPLAVKVDEPPRQIAVDVELTKTFGVLL
jgi:hypothetical protein